MMSLRKCSVLLPSVHSANRSKSSCPTVPTRTFANLTVVLQFTNQFATASPVQGENCPCRRSLARTLFVPPLNRNFVFGLEQGLQSVPMAVSFSAKAQGSVPLSIFHPHRFIRWRFRRAGDCLHGSLHRLISANGSTGDKAWDQLTARSETCSSCSSRAMPVACGSSLGLPSTRNRY